MKEKIKRILALHHATVLRDEIAELQDLHFDDIESYAQFVLVVGNQPYNWDNLVEFYKNERDCPELAEMEEDTFLKDAYNNWFTGCRNFLKRNLAEHIPDNKLCLKWSEEKLEKLFLEAFYLTEAPTSINNNFDQVKVGDIIFGDVLGGGSPKSLLVNTVGLLKFNFNEYKDLLYINNTIYFEKIERIYRYNQETDSFIRII